MGARICTICQGLIWEKDDGTEQCDCDLLMDPTKCDKCKLDFDDIDCRHYCRDCAVELPENNPYEDYCEECIEDEG